MLSSTPQLISIRTSWQSWTTRYEPETIMILIILPFGTVVLAPSPSPRCCCTRSPLSCTNAIRITICQASLEMNVQISTMANRRAPRYRLHQRAIGPKTHCTSHPITGAANPVHAYDLLDISQGQIAEHRLYVL